MAPVVINKLLCFPQKCLAVFGLRRHPCAFVRAGCKAPRAMLSAGWRWCWGGFEFLFHLRVSPHIFSGSLREFEIISELDKERNAELGWWLPLHRAGRLIGKPPVRLVLLEGRLQEGGLKSQHSTGLWSAESESRLGRSKDRESHPCFSSARTRL